MIKLKIEPLVLVLLWALMPNATLSAHSIVTVVAKVKQAVVGVGLHDPLGQHTQQLRGTGFVFGDGSFVATNYHVVSQDLDPQYVQHHIVFSGIGATPKVFKARIIAQDIEHDLAILKLDTVLRAADLASGALLADGTDILLTGFPIGPVLGLYPATHRGILAATTPDVIPSSNADRLTSEMINKLKNPSLIYQLDITAYPGNSGSPVYDATNGEVIGILNKVFLKNGKESVLQNPSGISYAIPIHYLRALAKKAHIAID
jgi:S1-C subfamily serine protease